MYAGTDYELVPPHPQQSKQQSWRGKWRNLLSPNNPKGQLRKGSCTASKRAWWGSAWELMKVARGISLSEFLVNWKVIIIVIPGNRSLIFER